MAGEAVPGYLRMRVVNRSPRFWMADSFDFQAPLTPVSPYLWHSLGTEAGTDNSITYWTQVAGAWTYASHLVTSPVANNALIVGGNSDWTDIVYTLRFKWTTGTAPGAVIHCDGSINNLIFGQLSSAALSLNKIVGGVATVVTTTAQTPVNGTFYWLLVRAVDTNYTVELWSDNAGGRSSLLNSVGPTAINDAGLVSGLVGIKTAAGGTVAATTHGGAFGLVCGVQGTPPDGTQGQAWTPVVIAGEPAFAWAHLFTNYFASIQIIGSTSGSGAWQQRSRLFAGSAVRLSGFALASAGSANFTAGGLTTGDAVAASTELSASGAMTADPLVSCNYSGGIGKATFHSVAITNPAYEITTDLPHLHQTEIEVRAMQPGSPGSNALGSFTVRLHPPGSDGYAAAKTVYDQLDYYQRVEMYISHDGASLGRLYYAGIITGIRKSFGASSSFELTGANDLVLANLSRPFPGEFFVKASTLVVARAYMGINLPAWMDDFSPFAAGDYLSTSLPGLTAGTWTQSTDDGVDAVTCSTGTGAVLLAKLGAPKADDTNRATMVEASGRLQPSASNTNAGVFGIVLAVSTYDLIQQVSYAYVTAKATSGASPYSLDVTYTNYTFDVLNFSLTVANALTAVDDGDGFIPITISIHKQAFGQSQVVVNGVSIWPTDPINGLPGQMGTLYPGSTYAGLLFAVPASGTARAYFSSLFQAVRVSDNGGGWFSSSTSPFKTGAVGSPIHTLNDADPGPTFLEIWTRCATREGWYWRYTPQPYVVGALTLGTVDMTADPGTDRASNRSIVFSRDVGNLVDLQLTANADQFSTSTVASAVPGTDGGGLAFWRDGNRVAQYGMIEDQVLAQTSPSFAEQRHQALEISDNRTSLGPSGSKSAIVLRDAETADGWRELDRIMIHEPELGLNYLTARVIAYTFREGQSTQTLTLDQFSADDPVLLQKRFQAGVFQVAAKFGTR